MKKTVCIILALFTAFSVTACSSKNVAADIKAPEPTQTPTPAPTPEPTPEPTPAPELPAGKAVTADGVTLTSGSVEYEGGLYVRADELCSALGVEFTQNGDTAVLEAAGSLSLLTYRGNPWVDVDAAAELLCISRYEDEELQQLYYTSGAGEWSIAAGYEIPVLMYHAVTDNVWGYDGLFVSPSAMEEQLAYLSENGYTTIFFEDLKNIADIEKPVLLTFDDGYEDNYTELFPLLKKYNAKATIFLISDWIGGEVYLKTDEIQEMNASGLVSFQSHSANHPDMATLGEDDQKMQLASSKLTITRLTGKEPFVFCYPSGSYNAATLRIMGDYYRFATVMAGQSFITGGDTFTIGRKYISRDIGMRAFPSMLGE